MLKVCDNNTLATGTIAGGAVHEPGNVRLGALWRHDSAKAILPRQERVSLIRDASDAIVRGGQCGI